MQATADWEVRCYESGTMLVMDVDHDAPWLYVYGPGNDDEDARRRDRYKVCEDLRDFLNGGNRPAWLDDLTRTSEDHAEDVDGTRIDATGPMVDVDPPNLNWRQDDSWESQLARAKLMDRLFFKR